MKMIHYLCAFLICLGFSSTLLGQELECTVTSEDADTKHMPHFGNNKVLDEVLKRTMPDAEISDGKIVGKSSNTFRIPIKIWLYRNDNGSNQALPTNEVYDLIDEVNQRFEDNGTGISFYLKCAIETVNSTQFNTIDSDAEYDLMTQTNYDDKALNWHLIRTSTAGFSGKGTFPWKAYNFSFTVEYGGSLGGNDTAITVHEIGHTLGLLHTHETRNGNWNGEAGNCYQESVSRTRKQGAFCISTAFKKKCEVNGDYLCSTAAAPNTSTNTHISVDINCNYTGSGNDNWGDTWVPPTINYMSYLSRTSCMDELDSGQIGVMHTYIVFYAHDGTIFNIGEPWYNKDIIYLSGTVTNGQDENIYAPISILVAEGSSTYTLNPGSDVLLRAQETIELFPGFYAQNGSAFLADVGPITNCSIYSNLNSNNMAKSKDNYNDVFELLKTALEAQETTASKTVTGTQSIVNVYPNPNHGRFLIESDLPMISWELRSQLGNVNISSKENMSAFKKATLDISNHSSGVYFLKVVLENGEIIVKHIIKE